MKEGVRIDHGIGANLEREVVAAELALMTDAGADPPDSRMKEEESFSKGLKEVPEEVGTADVGQFVGEHDFKLVWAERCCGRERQQNEGTQSSYSDGSGDGVGEAEKNGAAQAEGG